MRFFIIYFNKQEIYPLWTVSKFWNISLAASNCSGFGTTGKFKRLFKPVATGLWYVSLCQKYYQF